MKRTSRAEEAIGLACELGVFDGQERKRYYSLKEELSSKIADIHELEDGYAAGFQGTSQVLLKLAEYISLERMCCPFLSFKLEVGKSDAPITMSVTGPDGAKEFLRHELGL